MEREFMGGVVGQIRLEGLGRRFGAVTAVQGIDLDIAHGEFLALLGPSGCGKTTLLRMIAGLLPPSQGRILVDGTDVTQLPPKKRDLAMVFQSYALYPHLSVARNIGFPLRVRRLARAEIAERVGKVAAQLELGTLLDRRPRELSGGQRQRVALARALVRDPKAFLMDEPLSNLDAKLRTATRVELAALHRRLGSTFVYVTHDQVEAMTMATRIALINEGRLEQVGTPAEVYDQPASVFVAGFLGSPPMNLLPAEVATADGRVTVTASDVDVPLWHGENPHQQVILGVRPEHLTFTASGSQDMPLLRGAVRAVENLGSEEVAICDVAGADVAVRGPRPLGVAAGDVVTLTVDPAHVHLFDEPTGRRLVWQDEPAAVPA